MPVSCIDLLLYYPLLEGRKKSLHLFKFNRFDKTDKHVFAVHLPVELVSENFYLSYKDMNLHLSPFASTIAFLPFLPERNTIIHHAMRLSLNVNFFSFIALFTVGADLGSGTVVNWSHHGVWFDFPFKTRPDQFPNFFLLGVHFDLPIEASPHFFHLDLESLDFDVLREYIILIVWQIDIFHYACFGRVCPSYVHDLAGQCAHQGLKSLNSVKLHFSKLICTLLVEWKLLCFQCQKSKVLMCQNSKSTKAIMGQHRDSWHWHFSCRQVVSLKSSASSLTRCTGKSGKSCSIANGVCLGRILAQPIWVWWAGPEDCPGKERESDFAEDGKDCNSDNIIWTTQNHNKSEYEIRIIHTSINIATYLDLMPHALNFYNCSVEWKDRSRNLEKMGGQKGRSPCVASERCRPECRLTTRPDGAFLKVSGKVMSSPLKERSSGESLECKIHQDSWPVSVGIEVIRA